MQPASTPGSAEAEVASQLPPQENDVVPSASASTGPAKINVLKKLRSERKLTIAQLAELADLNPATISLIENNRRKAQGTTLGKLATFFEVSPDALWEIADTGAAERGALGGAAGRGRTKPRNTGTGMGTGNEGQDTVKAKTPTPTRAHHLPPDPKSRDVIPNVFDIDSSYPTFGAASPPPANLLKVKIEEFEPGSVEYRLAHRDKTLTVAEVIARLVWLRLQIASELPLTELNARADRLKKVGGGEALREQYRQTASWLQGRLEIRWD